MIDRIDYAFTKIGGETWDRQYCQCGDRMCKYCVIHGLLKDFKSYFIAKQKMETCIKEKLCRRPA